MRLRNEIREHGETVGRGAYECRLKNHQAAIKRRIKTHLFDCRICKVGDTVQGCDWYHALIGELVTVGQQIRRLK